MESHSVTYRLYPSQSWYSISRKSENCLEEGIIYLDAGNKKFSTYQVITDSTYKNVKIKEKKERKKESAMI